MTLVWRGMGIMVPITFIISCLLTGWISGDHDYTLGNSHMLGWGSLWTAIICLLMGVVALGGEAKDEQGNPVKKKHDFFWIPVIVWALIFGGLSLYLLVFAGKSEPEPSTLSDILNAPESSDADSTEEDFSNIMRVVNFYNPTDDSLTYIVADENGEGLIERATVAPRSFVSKEMTAGTYMFSAYNQAKETTLSLPAKEDAGDEKRYRKYKDDKGSFYQRILDAQTEDTDDYDEAWLVLDGETDLLVVNITEACDPDYTLAMMKEGDWADAIQEELDTRDLVEPLFKSYFEGKRLSVLAPGAKIPTDIEADQVICLLVPYRGEKSKDAVIEKAVKAARF
jgi:hypothetical protein